MTRIKICGLFQACHIQYVNEAMPDYAGFIINFPQSHRNVTPDEVRLLRDRLKPEVLPVGVFVNRPPKEVADLLNDGTLSMAQLHGQEDEAYLAALRQLTDGPVMQAFFIRALEDVRCALRSSADYLLFDSGQGSGKVFDWSLLKEISRPFFLAGGLNPDNLAAAIKAVQPFAVDLSSGVETNRTKERSKIFAAVAAVRSVTT